MPGAELSGKLMSRVNHAIVAGPFVSWCLWLSLSDGFCPEVVVGVPSTWGATIRDLDSARLSRDALKQRKRRRGLPCNWVRVNHVNAEATVGKVLAWVPG